MPSTSDRLRTDRESVNLGRFREGQAGGLLDLAWDTAIAPGQRRQAAPKENAPDLFLVWCTLALCAGSPSRYKYAYVLLSEHSPLPTSSRLVGGQMAWPPTQGRPRRGRVVGSLCIKKESIPPTKGKAS